MTIICLSIASCNTMDGMGKDFEKMGNGLQNTANRSIWGSNAPAYDVPQYDDAGYLPPQ